MGTNSPKTGARKAIGKFARTLLTTTCLTAASGGAAVASTITYNEGTLLTVFPPFTNLAAAPIPGTTIVNASQNEQITEFELSGLGTGTFALSATSNGTNGDFINVFSDSGFSSLIESGFANSTSPLSLDPLAIPVSGDLFIRTTPRFEQANSYSVTVNTTPTPEPSTVATVGLGLAASLTLARKRRKV